MVIPIQCTSQLESCESSGGDAPLTDTTATQPQAVVLVSSYESSGGDAPLTDTTATKPQATLLSPPVVSRKFVYSEEMVVFKMTC